MGLLQPNLDRFSMSLGEPLPFEPEKELSDERELQIMGFIDDHREAHDELPELDLIFDTFPISLDHWDRVETILRRYEVGTL